MIESIMELLLDFIILAVMLAVLSWLWYIIFNKI